jgi:hypothetical protein
MESLPMPQGTAMTSIVFVFDKSASMESLGDEPRQSLNTFYQMQKESGISFKSTLILFNNNVEFIHQNLDGNDVPILEKEHYIPSGMTSLLDAIGRGIEYQKNENINNVIFVILTDGLENSSRIYNYTQIKEMITEMESKHSWQFIYLGANQDAFTVGNNLGINVSADYDYTPRGLNTIMREVSTGITRGISDNTPITIERTTSCIESVHSENSNYMPLNPFLNINDIFSEPLEPPALSRSFSHI